ncbi:hypothetical protein BCR35DRAFT_327722 [Leucosporidium creatinivorum]|uniref:Uncharacterized protein n=1 Tax=Leucosporidium creatinivorum TaxID=106004 RepID=A0A1Y2G501_9BASI|nr:hypothetical protein BCR35DRAFT_327722 [Leucosporidium creatinivorum]
MLHLSTRLGRPVAHSARFLHTCTTLQPNPTVRNLALPLAFLSVKGWDNKGLEGWNTWTRLFSQAGYASLLIQLDPHSTTGPTHTSQALLASLEADLHSLLTSPSQGSPFPPLLFSSSFSTLLSQTYVSSHPLSGLFLHTPPSPPSAHSLQPSIFKSELKEFTYEPNFPIGVMDSMAQFEASRLGSEFGEEGEDGWLARVEGQRDEQGWEKAMEWMDENGL